MFEYVCREVVSPYTGRPYRRGSCGLYLEGRRPIEQQQWSPHLADVRDKLLQA